VKPGSSLPCSQEPATSSYPKPDESSHTLPFCLKSILVSYFHDALFFQMGDFLQDFLSKTFMHFYLYQCMPHTQPISSSLIQSSH